MNHPKCVCGKDGVWVRNCGCGYICVCECHSPNGLIQEKELEK